MNKTNFRTRVMSYAHHIFESTTVNWSTALKKAWTLARVAYGTLCNLPAGVTSRRSATKAPNFATMCYWDTKKQAFRSFKVENFIAIAV